MSKSIPPLDLMMADHGDTGKPDARRRAAAVREAEGPPGRRPRDRRGLPFLRADAALHYVPELGGTRMPQFRAAASFDPTYHTQHIALPDGGTYDELLRLVADLHEPCSTAPGRCSATGSSTACRTTASPSTRRCITQSSTGVSGTKRLYASLSPSARRSIPRRHSQPTSRCASRARRRRLVDRLAELGLTATGRRLPSGTSRWAPSRRGSPRCGRRPGRSAPFTAQRGPMNEPLQMARSIATLSLPLEEMHASAGTSARRSTTSPSPSWTKARASLLRRTGRAFAHRLVAFCPVSLRDEGDTAAGTKASAMFVHLGEHEATVIDRIGQVVAALDAGKQELRGMSKDAAMVYAVALPRRGRAELGDARRPPGAAARQPGDLERAGRTRAAVPERRTMVGTFPVSAIAMSVGLNVTLTSYHECMTSGSSAAAPPCTTCRS